jgi:hypothetical protein
MALTHHRTLTGRIRPTGAICRIDQCTNPADTDGMCEKHYRRVLRHGDPFIVLRLDAYPPDAQCTVPGCERRPHARGWCATHYHALYRPAPPAGLRS